MAVETEIKFAIDSPDDWAYLSGLSSIGPYTLTAVRRVAMVDSYLDTDEKTIERAGYAFRIRNVEERHIAGLKRVGRVIDGVHVREEFEQEVDPSLDPSDWPDGEVRSRLIDLLAGRRYEVHTRIMLAKEKRNVQDAGLDVAEWSLDEIRVPERDPDLVLRELEVELKNTGSIAVLETIDEELAPRRLRSLTVTKLDRARFT